MPFSPTIAREMNADPTSIPEGADATVTFTVTIDNDSNPSDPVTITSILDDVYGDLLDPANPDVSNNTCLALDGATIAPGDFASCSFDATVPAGDVGDTATDRVDVTANDDEGNSATDFDTEDVTYDNVDPVIDEVAALVRERGWQIEQLQVERGRLDEVFRNITKDVQAAN